ncbi:hypothetical protein C4J81_19135 (plasmid) [Deltaproteobacteria bacterium Smac51]|nr:hypothetical protein C4J81_19135 [Deltaproteobacteria bacterium Smac51]
MKRIISAFSAFMLTVFFMLAAGDYAMGQSACVKNTIEAHNNNKQVYEKYLSQLTAIHIICGDANGGGHKKQFPGTWSIEEILDFIVDTVKYKSHYRKPHLKSPDTKDVIMYYDSLPGTYNNLMIVLEKYKDHIITAYPFESKKK